MSAAPCPPRPEDPDALLARARHLLAADRDGDAYAAYLEVLAHGSFPFRRAARAGLLSPMPAAIVPPRARSMSRSFNHWPWDPVGRVNLGNILYDDGDLAASRRAFRSRARCRSRLGGRASRPGTDTGGWRRCRRRRPALAPELSGTGHRGAALSRQGARNPGSSVGVGQGRQYSHAQSSRRPPLCRDGAVCGISQAGSAACRPMR